MAKKWPEKVVQRSFIKEHSFPNSLYLTDKKEQLTYFSNVVDFRFYEKKVQKLTTHIYHFQLIPAV